MREKKVRGLKRRVNKFFNEYYTDTGEFPPDFKDYYEYHLPDKGAYWLNSSKIPYKLKRDCFQFLIDRTQHLIDLKPAGLESAKVCLMIDFQYWHATKIYIHIGSEEPVFEWDDEDVRVVKLDDSRDFSKEWDVNIPSGLSVIGTKSKIINKDFIDHFEMYGGEDWFIGEL